MEPRINEPIRQGKYASIKCWRFGGDHYLSSCPERKNKDARFYNLKEASIVGNVSRNIPHIYASLENLQEDHQSSMIEIEGKINNLPFSILNDSKSTISYVNTTWLKDVSQWE